MKQVEDLWEVRAKDYWNNAIRYLRLIGNSGFLFTIYLLIIIGGYYYSLFLAWLPETFPVAIALALLSGFYLTRSPVRTFVKHGDLVFLLPLESKLDTYFKRSLIYTFAFQAFGLILGAIVLGPLYFGRITEERQVYYLSIAVLLLVKLWNLYSSWNEQRLSSERERATHALFRYVLNTSFAYLLFSLAPPIYLLAIGAIFIALLVGYYRYFPKKSSLKWDRLLEVEEKMLAMFYRIANLFTDVPQLKSRIKRRTIAIKLFSLLPYKRKEAFVYLYVKSFVRASDYLGIYVRLLLIAALLLMVLPGGFIRLAVFLLFLYMSGLQLSTLWHQHDTKIWIDLYPIDRLNRSLAFSYIVTMFLILKAGILTLFLLSIGAGIDSAILLIIGVGFSYLYGYKIVHRRRKAA